MVARGNLNSYVITNYGFIMYTQVRMTKLPVDPFREVVAMPPPGGCARGGGQWAGTHGPPRSVPARRVEEDNGTQ